MPNPTKGDVHVNKPLTNISIAYIQKQTNYVADKVFPTVPVSKQGDRYFVYDKGDFLRDEAKPRAPGSASAGGGFRIDNTPSYFCDVNAFHKDIDDQTRSNADDPINMDRDATEYVTQKMLLRREKLWVSKYFTTGIWSGAADFTPGTLWSAASSSPLTDVAAKIEAIKKQTGYKANRFVVSSDVHAILRNHAETLDRIKYTQMGIITEQLLAAMFGVEQYLVMDAVENTAKEGLTASMDFLGTKDCLLVYAAPSPSLMQPSGGYTFSWTGYLGAGAMGSRIKSFRMEELASDRVEGEMAFDQKLVGSDLGVFFSNVIA